MTSGDFLTQRLLDWGIERVYGYPGDGINGVMAAFERKKDKLKFIQTRHEEMAAFMACAHSKFTGEVGVCAATSGPGAIHLLNGLYDAKMDHQSVVAIVGQKERSALGGSFQQEVDLVSLFKDVAGDYVQMASSSTQVRHLVDRAIRIAKSERTVTCIIIPEDIQEETAVEKPPHTHSSIHSGTGYNYPVVIPAEKDLKEAADILNEGKKVAMLVGAGAMEAKEEIKEVADQLGAGVAKALLGKTILDDNLSYVTGSIGLLGTRPSWDLMTDCDTLLMVGTSFPYPEFLPKEGQAKCVQIDISGKKLSLRYPNDVSLHGDSKETLRALMPKLKRKTDRSWREKIESSIKDWWEILEARAMNSADPLNPQRVFWELSKQLPDNSILTADSGSAANWYARDIKVKESMMGSLSGNLATMGPGVPYAIAAKFAFPDRPAIAMVGDGAMQMNGNAELLTIKKYYKEWSDPRLIILVLNNRDLNQVTWEQRVLTGVPKFDDSQVLPDFSYAEYAKSIGLQGIRVDNPDELEGVWTEAMKASRPVVVEAITDPEVPPLPPHISLEQAKNFLASMLKGDPNWSSMAKQAFKDTVEDFVH